MNKIEIGNRLQIASEFMDEKREFQVYLPPTYYFNDKNDYPVVYLLDGDYNFHYVTGLIELMSNVSGKMPECIVVGITDKGASKYRKNCTPNQIKGRDGNAENYIKFIDNELKPLIKSKYRTADYNIIIGHSIGGLFVTNFLLKKPDAFNAFIAIDPALWLGEFEIINRADSIYESKDSLSSLFYISSSNARGMGIDKYITVLEKQFSDNKNWKYFNLENENHNSVGLPTIKKSFEDIFINWSISEKQFKSFKGANEVIDHYRELSKTYSFIVSIHPYFLGNIIYYYFNLDNKEDLLVLENGIKEHFPSSLEEFYNQLALNYFEIKEYQKAIENYNKSITYNSSSFNAYDGISKVYLAQGKYESAILSSEKSIELAKTCNARQWMLNQLIASLENIKNETKK
ncbi:MAG: alpha/beta hydrolase-fold protein [Psychroserpens sp.]|uniref:alpha/beta hydrolase-fold protein n=1 Tax=Psychroserpens sp. TaxID=2020870 RepID=UPI00300371AB